MSIWASGFWKFHVGPSSVTTQALPVAAAPPAKAVQTEKRQKKKETHSDFRHHRAFPPIPYSVDHQQ